MKRILTFLLVLALGLFSLTACGGDKKKDDTNAPGGSVIAPDNSTIPGDAGTPEDDRTHGDVSGNGSGSSMPDGALNNGTVEENPAESRKDADTSDGAASSSAARSAAREGREEALFRPASYRQMLRNAQVHDRDGDLTDGENAVTPGVLH